MCEYGVYVGLAAENFLFWLNDFGVDAFLVTLNVCIFPLCLFFFWFWNSRLRVWIFQYLPDSIILTTPVCRFKNTHLPAIAVFFASVAVLVGVLRWIAVLQILFGIQIAWIYLRFYQVHDDGEPKGDTSDHFAWAT